MPYEAQEIISSKPIRFYLEDHLSLSGYTICGVVFRFL